MGPRLEAATDGLERRINRLTLVSPATAHVARMFSINLANWRGNEFVRANHPTEDLDRLAAGLSELTGSQDAAQIRWEMRQIAVERSRPA